MDKITIAENAMHIGGIAVGVANIESILGWVILIIQLGWLITKLIIKIVNAVKSNTSVETLDDEVDEVIEMFEEIKGSMNNERENIEQK